MFSYEKRKKAVDLYFKYHKNGAAVIRELGYPSRNALRYWVKEFENEGLLHENNKHKSKYSDEQRRLAVNHYLDHGKSISKTIRAIGYPNRYTMSLWLKEDVEGYKSRNVAKSCQEVYTDDYKKEAVIDLMIRDQSVKDIADNHGVTSVTLYKWKNSLLGNERECIMNNKIETPTNDKSNNEKEKLNQEIEKLRREVYRLQLEKDILEKATQIIKKEEGINLNELTNSEKTLLIDALKENYSLKELLFELKISKSSYYYQKNVMKLGDKYRELRLKIANIFNSNYQSYGYRRVHAKLKKEGISVSEKVVLRLMKEEGLIVISTKEKKYSSYKGEISPEVDNIVNRYFHSDKPNEILLTDITEFSIPAGKVYLSPMIDCFDGLVSSWSIGTSPNAELVNSMLDATIANLKDGEHPIVHSDRGCHYRWPGWIQRMDDNNLIRSMSRKGCSPDNSACEGFFGRLKNEVFYKRDWKDVSLDEFIEIINNYIKWYNETRIKQSLGFKSPVEYRKELGLI